MQDNEKKPALRFKGFTDPWEQRKVGTLIEDYTEKTVTQNQYPVLTSSQQQGIVLQEDYFADRQVTTDNNVGYYVLPKGYFTYRSRSDTDVFVFNRNNIVDKGIISYYYPVFAPKSCDSNFLLRRLNHGIKKQLSMAAEGTGQKVLAHAKFKNMVVDVPSQSEQEKIGTILEELDTLITLHQRKYEKLVNIKKSMLDKMFPQNGASVPEIRFKGFTDPWEQRKLGEIAKEVVRNDPASDAPIMMITAGNGFIEQSDRYAFNNAGESLKKYILLECGELAYNHGASKLRPYGSCFALTTVEKARIPFVYHCFSVEKSNPEFLSIELNGANVENQLRKIVSSGARMDGLLNIAYSEYTEVTVQLPKKEEQDWIAKFFKQLDTLITLHQRKLEKLQNIKKSCLEKMFV